MTRRKTTRQGRMRGERFASALTTADVGLRSVPQKKKAGCTDRPAEPARCITASMVLPLTPAVR